VAHGELGGKGDRLIDGPLFDDFAQILRFGRGKFPHPHFVKNNQIELGEFCAIPKVGPARAGDRKILWSASFATPMEAKRAVKSKFDSAK